MQVPKRKSEENNQRAIDHHVTQKKFNEMTATLARLKASRPKLAEEVKILAQMGDFSENAAYQIAKGRLRGVNQRILEINDFLNRAIIIAHNKSIDIVELGHQVTLESKGKQKIYQILGSAETNPEQGIISHNSPLGAALLGHKLGDVIKIQLNKKDVEYKIVKIS